MRYLVFEISLALLFIMVKKCIKFTIIAIFKCMVQ